MGGQSAEAEVSRNSARQVAEALTAAGHRAELVELDGECPRRLLSLEPDVVFPALHGPPGEDGTVQGFLEIMGLPYVGSPVRGSALAMDKSVAKSIFAEHGLPVAPGIVVSSHEQDLDRVSQRVDDKFGHGIVIKPLNQGSAIGVTPLPEGGDVQAAVQAALAYGDCLIEPFVMGKEITVGVLETAGKLHPHPVIEIVTASDEWYDFENRYTPGQSEHVIPADLPEDVAKRLQNIATEAHRCLGLRDLSRADFIVRDDGGIILLEVNTLPGMTPTSLYPEGAQYLGYDFAKLVDLLVTEAAHRS
jgi:D-alanine-D-alanine ligase